MTNNEWLNGLDTEKKADFLTNIQQNGSSHIVSERIHCEAGFIVNKIWELWLKAEHKE